MSEKGIMQQEFDELQEAANALESAFNDFDQALRNTQMHERWKAYGKQVSNEYVSMGPCMSEVMEQLEKDIGSDDDDEEENPCGQEECSNPDSTCEDCHLAGFNNIGHACPGEGHGIS